MPDRFFQDSHDRVAGDAVWFPIAGLIIMVPSLVVLGVLALFDVPSLLAAALLVLAGIGVTGALHEDGLADVADGFWGGKTRDDVLHIMRDSRIGTYGAVGICGSMLVRVAALAAIFETAGPVGVAAALLAQAMIARAAMVWLWSSLPPARTNGLSKGSGQPAENQGWIALSMAAVLILPLLAIWSIGPFILALAFCALTLWFFRRLVKARISGHTGDTLGACEQLISAAFLTALASAA